MNEPTAKLQTLCHTRCVSRRQSNRQCSLHSQNQHLWDTLVGHFCGTPLWDTLAERSCLVGHFCGTPLWDTCRAPLWGPFVGHPCGTFLWDNLLGHFCGTPLWETFVGFLVGHPCGTLLWDTLAEHSLVGHSCRTLLQTPKNCFNTSRNKLQC